MKRHELPVLLKAQYDENIRSQLYQLQQPYQKIGFYISVNDEVDTRRILNQLLRQGKQIAVPKCVSKDGKDTLEFYWIDGLEDCIQSRFGLLEPVAQASRKVDPDELQMIVVPLVAFDGNKNRIGYGMGYYDSVLAGYKGMKVGLGYALQKVMEIQPDPFDIPLNTIITEKGSL